MGEPLCKVQLIELFITCLLIIQYRNGNKRIHQKITSTSTSSSSTNMESKESKEDEKTDIRIHINSGTLSSNSSTTVKTPRPRAFSQDHTNMRYVNDVCKSMFGLESFQIWIVLNMHVSSLTLSCLVLPCLVLWCAVTLMANVLLSHMHVIVHPFHSPPLPHYVNVVILYVPSYIQIQSIIKKN